MQEQWHDSQPQHNCCGIKVNRKAHSTIRNGGNNSLPLQFNEDKRWAVVKMESMATMCNDKSSAADVWPRQNNHLPINIKMISSLAIRYTSILVTKDLSVNWKFQAFAGTSTSFVPMECANTQSHLETFRKGF